MRQATTLPERESPGGEAKDTRLSLLNHDLRSAVSEIVGSLRLIDQTRVDEETQVQLERIRTCTEQLGRILDDAVADTPQRPSRRLSTPSNINLPRFLSDLEKRWSGHASQRGLSFRVEMLPDVPQVIALDRIALDRILTNALSNAMKFAVQGEVAVRVRLENEELRFSVTDEGPGLSGKALDRLFQRGGRPEGSRTPGTGLGLFISKELAERLGGKLRVKNRRNRGACVRLDLPPESWGVPGALRDDRLPDLSQLKILVAEDNPTLQLMVSKMLGRLGAEFEIAGDGVEAVDWLQRERFDLLLLDIEMPRMSGLDVLKSVRRMPPPLDAMPVIVMTAFVLETNQQAIFGAGADGIIPKPISRLESFGTSILNHYHSALERPAAALPDDATPVEALRLRRLLEMSGEADREELLSRLEIDLCAARDGLRPAQGVVSGKEIRAITHILVALAGAIGAETLHENAKALNRAAHHEEDDRVEALRLRTLAQLDRLIPIVQSHKEEGDAAPDPGAAPYEKELQA